MGTCSMFVLWWDSSHVHQHSQRGREQFRAHYAESINFAFACVCSYLIPSLYPVVMTTLLYIAIAFKRKWEVQRWAFTAAEMHWVSSSTSGEDNVDHVSVFCGSDFLKILEKHWKITVWAWDREEDCRPDPQEYTYMRMHTYMHTHTHAHTQSHTFIQNNTFTGSASAF